MNITHSDNPISLPDAAKQLNISVRGLYRLMARKELPHPVKVGGLSKLFETDLKNYKTRLKSQRNTWAIPLKPKPRSKHDPAHL